MRGGTPDFDAARRLGVPRHQPPPAQRAAARAARRHQEVRQGLLPRRGRSRDGLQLARSAATPRRPLARRRRSASASTRSHEVDATARDNKYLHAVLLNYGKGGNTPLDPTAGLRDYVVQVDPTNPDLYLGKAYCAFGPLRVPIELLHPRAPPRRPDRLRDAASSRAARPATRARPWSRPRAAPRSRSGRRRPSGPAHPTRACSRSAASRSRR